MNHFSLCIFILAIVNFDSKFISDSDVDTRCDPDQKGSGRSACEAVRRSQKSKGTEIFLFALKKCHKDPTFFATMFGGQNHGPRKGTELGTAEEVTTALRRTKAQHCNRRDKSSETETFECELSKGCRKRKGKRY